MIRAIISAIVIVLVTFGLNSYLQPNDFNCCSCPNNPNADLCSKVDAIVAISGGDTNARADEAIKLFKNGKADILIFSGAAQDKSGPSNAFVMKERAKVAGIADTSIFIDESSESTSENAKNVQKIFLEHDVKKAILVTSGYHQRRAYLEFQRHAPDVRIANNPVQNDRDWSGYWWLSLRGWLLATSEVIKITAFYIVGIWS